MLERALVERPDGERNEAGQGRTEDAAGRPALGRSRRRQTDADRRDSADEPNVTDPIDLPYALTPLRRRRPQSNEADRDDGAEQAER